MCSTLTWGEKIVHGISWDASRVTCHSGKLSPRYHRSGNNNNNDNGGTASERARRPPSGVSREILSRRSWNVSSGHRWPRRLRKVNWNGHALEWMHLVRHSWTAARCRCVYECGTDVIARDFLTRDWIRSVNCRCVSRMSRRPLDNYRRIAWCTLRHRWLHTVVASWISAIRKFLRQPQRLRSEGAKRVRESTTWQRDGVSHKNPVASQVSVTTAGQTASHFAWPPLFVT